MLQLSTGGDLFTYITSHPRRRLCEGEAKYITFQIFKGLQYLHDKMISHRGKPLLVSSLACCAGVRIQANFLIPIADLKVNVTAFLCYVTY